MVRELAIIIYLLVFRIVFSFFKLFPHQQKTLFVTYFGYNALYTIEELEKHVEEEIVVVTNRHCRVSFESKQNRSIIRLEKFGLYKWLRFVYHLATADKVLVDNYYGFLAVTKFKPSTKCIQLWHANGAIKKFGLTDMSVKNRGRLAIKRFKNVYNRFDHVVVGSDEMAYIFQKSFGLGPERILKTGIPRTDFFFDEEKKQKEKNRLLETYPVLRQKKVILYAPTFRDSQFENPEMPLDITFLQKSLGDKYVLMIKNHPLVKTDIHTSCKDFVVEVADNENVNNLLLVTDILISDYSSIPFEYAFLEKPMIFYAYDLEDYTKTRGIWGEYKDLVPGPIAKSTEDILHIIQEDKFDTKQIQDFQANWNAYSHGKSSENLVKFLFPHLFETTK